MCHCHRRPKFLSTVVPLMAVKVLVLVCNTKVQKSVTSQKSSKKLPDSSTPQDASKCASDSPRILTINMQDTAFAKWKISISSFELQDQEKRNLSQMIPKLFLKRNISQDSGSREIIFWCQNSPLYHQTLSWRGRSKPNSNLCRLVLLGWLRPQDCKDKDSGACNDRHDWFIAFQIQTYTMIKQWFTILRNTGYRFKYQIREHAKERSGGKCVIDPLHVIMCPTKSSFRFWSRLLPHIINTITFPAQIEESPNRRTKQNLGNWFLPEIKYRFHLSVFSVPFVRFWAKESFCWFKDGLMCSMDGLFRHPLCSSKFGQAKIWEP